MKFPELWGMIPNFIDPASEEPLKDQLDRSYICGFKHQEGFTLRELSDGTYHALYEGDPPQIEVDRWEVCGQLLVLFPYAYVAAIEADGSYAVARMD